MDEVEGKAKKALLSETGEEGLYQVKVRFLGKKGEVTEVLKGVGSLNPEDRPEVGARANRFKTEFEALYDKQLSSFRAQKLSRDLGAKKVDVTLPGLSWPKGHFHPVNLVMDEIREVFFLMGFDVCEGPEIETDYYNFEALNIPVDHPARDMQDSFFVGEGRLLRTHTSPVQIRVMEKSRPPIRMIAPGVVYRRDSDVTHSPMFHQIEGLVVDKGISLRHLKGVIEASLRKIFKSSLPVKFRPSYFPFTEPSAEVDIQCVLCTGKGCRVCSGTGWLEVMGCGMVDPEVFRAVKIDAKKVTGFAFGMGIERIAMLKYGIGDIRLFFENSLKFLEQF